MTKTLIAALLALAAAPAFAEPSCNPGTDLKPVWESIKSFEDQGGEVMSFKIKVDGTKMEVFFDPNTGEELDRIAA